MDNKLDCVSKDDSIINYTDFGKGLLLLKKSIPQTGCDSYEENFRGDVFRDKNRSSWKR